MARVQFQSSINVDDEGQSRGRTRIAGTRYCPAVATKRSIQFAQPVESCFKKAHITFNPQQEWEALSQKHREEQVSLAAFKCRHRSPTPSPLEVRPATAPQQKGFKAKLSISNLRIMTKMSTPNLRLPPTPPMTSPLPSPLTSGFQTSEQSLRLPPTPDSHSPCSPNTARIPSLRCRGPMDTEDDIPYGSFPWSIPATPVDDEGSSNLFKTLTNVFRRKSSNTNLNRPATSGSGSGRFFNPNIHGRPPPLKRAPKLADMPEEMPTLSRSSTGNLIRGKFGFRSKHERMRSQSVPSL